MRRLSWVPSKLKDGTVVEFLMADWEPDDVVMQPGTIKCRVWFVMNDTVDSRVITLTAELLEEIDPC